MEKLCPKNFVESENAEDDIEKQIDISIGKFYQNAADHKDAVVAFLQKNEKITQKEIDQRLEHLQQIRDEDDFIAGFKKLFPRSVHVKKEGMQTKEEFVRINDVLSYGITSDGRAVHIHVVPDRDDVITKDRAHIKKYKELFYDGLKKLAEIVERERQIEQITATSKMVKNNPKIIKKMGFEDHGAVDEVLWQAHFSQDKREDVHFAKMGREAFLKKYLH